MWSDAVKSLRAAQMPAEAGDHLIEDQQGATVLAELLDLQEIARAWKRSGLRFHDHAGNSLRIEIEKLLQACQVVIAELQSQIRYRAGNSCIHFKSADEPVVG